MAKQLRTKTTYDFDTLLELQKVVGGVLTRKQTWRWRAILLVTGLAGLGVGIWMAPRGKFLTAGICCAWGVVALLWDLFFYHIRAWQAGRMMKGTVVVDFVFEKEAILVFQGGRSSRYPYTDAQDLLETGRCLYVILKSGQGLMMDKDNVGGGTAGELKAWLEEKSGLTARPAGRV